MKLTHGGKTPVRGVAKRSRAVKRIGAVAALGLGALLMSGCDARDAMRFGWPEGITPQARDMGNLWTWSVIACLVVGILVWAAIFWTITFHRAKAGQETFPRQTAYNVPIELTLTAIPFLVIAVLFYYTVIVQNNVEAKQDNPSVVVDVTAFQWNWKFGYREVRGADGQPVKVSVDGKERTIASKTGGPFQLQQQVQTNAHGHEIPLPAGGRSDDVRNYLHFSNIETVGTSAEIPVLVLPTGKRIEFDIASGDVIHSFWVPEFLFKRDVMPFPKQNHSDPSFQISSIDTEGAFVGRCAEMCGTYHSMMNFEVRAVSPQEFERYVAYRLKNPGATNAQSLAAICQQPVSVTTVPFDTRRGTNGSTPKDIGDPTNTKLANCTPEV
ncbi:cytochrome c oxidase subunit II [Gordonia effusa NBRC 100432]|uniref:cytochrome-c oxidase n=1 Tax=Gordonia effusa NBRC 100432 TaxID=1077974 RepID=H0QV21_9ACTN|nr:cytochrome c oxidase subunit II [Gordonia effusa]GAB16672.1 cytochrome c oxidase subunit II [Gordonia effusa NBRC 100432]